MSLTEKRKIHYQKQSTGNIDFNTNEIEPKLDQVIANTAHSVLCQELVSQSIPGSGSYNMSVLDIGIDDGTYTVQVAGSENHALGYTLYVSSDNITFFPYPIVVTTLNGFISSTFSLTFRYSYLNISNPTGVDKTASIIICARH